MSSIGSFGSNNYLQGQDPLSLALKNSGISADKLKAVSSDINAVFQSQSDSSSSPPDRTSIRAAINAKLSLDVSSGTLSSTDASKITAALDKLDQQFQSGAGQGQAGGAGGPPPGGTRPDGPPPGGPPPGGKSSSGGHSSASSSDSVAQQLIDLINNNSTDSTSSSSSDSSTLTSSSASTLESYLKKLLSQNFVDTSA